MSYLDYPGLQHYDEKIKEYIGEVPAQPSGTYPDMTAGNAKQLESSLREVDRVPYNFRSAGGSLEIGDREYDGVHGGSVVWNQLAKELNSTNWGTESGATASFDSGIITLSSTTAGNGAQSAYYLNTEPHKYMIGFSCKGTSGMSISGTIGSVGGTNHTVQTSDKWERAVDIIAPSTSYTNRRLYLYVGGQTYSNVQFKDVICVDLTLLLGSTLADYIYTLETATAGSGIAKLKSWGFFTKDYYPYHAPSMESVQVSAHKMVGFNAYNSETGKALVLSGHEYKIEGTYTGLTINGETVTPVSGIFTPSENGELVVAGGGSDTCIFIHWDNSRDGEYQPYTEYTYPLDDSLTLRGIPKKDEDGNLYYDGDVYSADGTVTRMYGVVDLGTLTWVKRTTINDDNWRFYAALSGVKGVSSGSTKANMVCSKYTAVSPNDTYTGVTGISSNSIYDDDVFVCDMSYSDETTFKTAMDGVYLVYELATPTTETADPFQSPQIVDNWGTEQYIDAGDRDFEMPVGHRTEYPVSLKDKIESAPNLPATDGIYVLKYENGQASYVLLESVSNA